jgi:hypothetical protein
MRFPSTSNFSSASNNSKTSTLSDKKRHSTSTSLLGPAHLIKSLRRLQSPTISNPPTNPQPWSSHSSTSQRNSACNATKKCSSSPQTQPESTPAPPPSSVRTNKCTPKHKTSCTEQTKSIFSSSQSCATATGTEPVTWTCTPPASRSPSAAGAVIW